MPDLPHLPLQRVEPDHPRRKIGYGRPPNQQYDQHGPKLSRDLNEVMKEFRSRRPPDGINPDLILRVKLNEKSMVDEDTWERSGLTLLSVDQNRTLVLFSSDADLTDFKQRLIAYAGGPPSGQKTAPHSYIFACIDKIGTVLPEDRIGRLLRQQGINSPAAFVKDREYTLDVELWDLGTNDLCHAKMKEISDFVRSRGGAVTDRYHAESLVLLRMRCLGALVHELLSIDAVALIDLPPTPSLAVSQALDLGIKDFPFVPSPGDNAPTVAILDSGIMSGHPFLTPTISEATVVPNSLGDPVDRHGHGTMVAGLAVYGDVEACITARSFIPQIKLLSARVLNDQCEFDNERLVINQMRDAIQYFRQTYGCRVFNISLGDSRQPYCGGKVSPWASVLDSLAREFNAVIVVSAGNYQYDPPEGASLDSHLREYPKYLLDDQARIIEPATGAIVLTVGAIASSANVPIGGAERVGFRPIAQHEQPSPFSRSGLGIGGAIKPDLCDFGGNRIYDIELRRLRDVRECSIISFYYKYLERLFTTDNGTSYAAPRVANIAAKLFGVFPDASANLIRALLASSSSVPQAAADLLSNYEPEAILRLCGYGRPDLGLAQTSRENRVVLFTDTLIAYDNFHIYEVPLPEEFLMTAGQRAISATLAFDPPVRHSRFDYLGAKMSFRLIRGKSVEQIVDAFRQRAKEEEPFERLTSTPYDCSFIPGSRTREAGTLQKASFTMKRNPAGEYGSTYYFVVRCERKWARDEQGPQRYAVVLVVEHAQELNLYNTIRQRVQARIQMQR